MTAPCQCMNGLIPQSMQWVCHTRDGRPTGNKKSRFRCPARENERKKREATSWLPVPNRGNPYPDFPPPTECSCPPGASPGVAQSCALRSRVRAGPEDRRTLRYFLLPPLAGAKAPVGGAFFASLLVVPAMSPTSSRCALASFFDAEAIPSAAHSDRSFALM